MIEETAMIETPPAGAIPGTPDTGGPPDEAALRRPDFVGEPRATSIRLANGQSWLMPKPVIELRLNFDDSGRPGFGGKPMYGDGGTRCFGQSYLDLLDRINEAKGDVEFLDAMAGVVVTLLRMNYDLTDSHLQTLLPWVVGPDDDNEAMWRAIRGVVTGEAPKTEPAGGESDSSSPAGSPGPSS